jgi:putative restriction endonuclease
MEYRLTCIDPLLKNDFHELLFASHIIPWSINEKERLNPGNGLCLSATFDKAFDKGFIGIDVNYNILISGKLKKHSKMENFKAEFGKHEGLKINTPSNIFQKKNLLNII